MGFRSTLVSEHYYAIMPNWFIEKYKDILYINGSLIASITEFKIYSNDIFDDYHRALLESGFFNTFDLGINIVVLAEDGNISKVCVFREKIYYYSPTDFVEEDKVYMQ